MPDELAPLAAAALLIILAVSIAVVWRRRVAEERERGNAVTAWPPGPSWRPGTVAEAVATTEWSESDRWSPASRLDDLDDDFAGAADDHPFPPGELVAAVPAQRTVETHQMRGGAAPSRTERDLRDRLVAVLLLDHEAAVGAMDELAACQQRLARLAEATRAERAQLAGLLTRLSETGLSAEQLARLADLPLDEVRGHLMARA